MLIELLVNKEFGRMGYSVGHKINIPDFFARKWIANRWARPAKGRATHAVIGGPASGTVQDEQTAMPDQPMPTDQPMRRRPGRPRKDVTS